MKLLFLILLLGLFAITARSQFTQFPIGFDGVPQAKSKCCKYTYAHSYTYKFDNHGNWIEQQNIYSQPNREPDPEWMRKYRVITYYSDGETKHPQQ